MKERPAPYIGISGISESQPNKISTQFWLMDQFVWAGLDSDSNPNMRQIALGVKATHKTQYLDIENKYSHEWYPVGEEEFAAALRPSWGVYCAQIYFDSEYVANADYRDEFVARICRRGKQWLNALQFDLLPWHEDDTMLPFLEKVKRETKHTIILQAHGEAMERLGEEGVVRMLGQYAHALDYVLFDASHGKGVRMEPGALLPFLGAAYESKELAGVGFGVAGGLCAEVVREELPVLLEKHHDLSVDAEGKLHKAYEDGTYGLDWSASKHYLQAMDGVLSALPRRNV